MFKTFVNEAKASPIQHIFPYVANLPTYVAASKKSQAQELCKEVSLHITDDKIWKCHYTPSEKTIYISKRALEILWCVSFGYVMFYVEVCQKKGLIKSMAEEPISLDLTSIPEIKDALSLLSWGLEELLNEDNENSSDWPKSVAAPAVADGEPANWRDGTMLYVTSFFMMHELYHHACGHEPNRPPEDSIDQERQADNMAADYLLGHLEPKDDKFFVRGLGMAIALVADTAVDIHIGHFRIKTHPRSFDRLYGLLDRYLANDPDNHVWLFVLCLLMLHIDNSELKKKLKVNFTDRRTFRGMVNSYIDALAEVTDLKEFFKLIS